MADIDWVTGLLAAATVWLAAETRRMVKATKEIAGIAAEPYLSLVGVVVQHTTQTSPTGKKVGYRIRVNLRNPGQVRIVFEVSDMAADVKGVALGTNPVFDNRAGVLHPAEETAFSYPFIESAEPMVAGLSGTVTFDAAFWVLDTERKRLRFKISFNVESINADGTASVRFMYVSGPTYA